MGASVQDIFDKNGKYTPQDNVIHHAENGCAIGLNCPAPSQGAGWYVDARSNKFVGVPYEIRASGPRFYINGEQGPRISTAYYDDTEVTLEYTETEDGPVKTKSVMPYELWNTKHNSCPRGTQNFTNYDNGFVSGNMFGVYPLHIEGVPASFAYDPLRGFNTGRFMPVGTPAFSSNYYDAHLGRTLTASIRNPFHFNRKERYYSYVLQMTRPECIGTADCDPTVVTTSTANTAISNLKICSQFFSEVAYVTLDFDLDVTDRPSTLQSTTQDIPIEYWYRNTPTTISIDVFKITDQYALHSGMTKIPSQRLWPVISMRNNLALQAVCFSNEYGSIYNPISTTNKMTNKSTVPAGHIYMQADSVIPPATVTPSCNSVIVGARPQRRTSTYTSWAHHNFTNGVNEANTMYAPENNSGSILNIVIPSMDGVYTTFHADNPNFKRFHVSMTFSSIRTRVPSANLFKYFNYNDASHALDDYYIYDYWGTPEDGQGDRNEALLSTYGMYYSAAGHDWAKVALYPAQSLGPSGTNTRYVINDITQTLDGAALVNKQGEWVTEKCTKAPYIAPNGINIDNDSLFAISGECAISCGFKTKYTGNTKLLRPNHLYRPSLYSHSCFDQVTFTKYAYEHERDLPAIHTYADNYTQDSAGAVLCPFNNNVYVTGEFRYDHFRMGLNMAYFGCWGFSGNTIGTSASLMRPAWDTLDLVSDPSDALTYTFVNDMYSVSGSVYSHNMSNLCYNRNTYKDAVHDGYLCVPNKSDMWQKGSDNVLRKSTLYPYVFGMRSGRYEQPDRLGNYHCVMQGDVWKCPPRGGYQLIDS